MGTKEDNAKAMREAVARLKTRAVSLHAEDVGHSELGPTMGFQEVEAAKNAATEFASDLLTRIEGQFERLNADLALQQLGSLGANLDALETVRRDMNEAAKLVNNPQFPNQRKNIVANAKSNATSLRVNLASLDQHVRLLELEDMVRAKPAAERLAEIDALAKQAGQIVSNLRDSALQKGLGVGRSGFGELEQAHRRQEQVWLIAFIIGVALTFVAVVFAVVARVQNQDLTSLVALAIRRLLLIAAPAAIAKVALTKYNLERNLRIIYGHRSAVLDQYRTFEAAIADDDRDAKNQFRLEIARAVFSDPQTGYTGAAASDFNVNPIVNVAERLGGVGKST